jgi:hypothetical protein
MDSSILEDSSFQIDLEQLKKTLRIKEGSGMAEKIEVMALEAQRIGRPKICYRPAYVETRGEDFLIIEGIRFTSRVLTVNLGKAFRVFPYVATCGQELEGWSKSVEGVLEQFWAEVIKEKAVRCGVKFLHNHLLDSYQPGELSRMNPGSLPDWPLSEQKPLFSLLGRGPDSIGVKLKDSFLMTPVKSVSGIWFPTEERFESCMLCQREKCPGRRAPYNPDLFDRKYRR